ncbi:hypothetical protein RN001_009146 [Aquatica leii]|uniref:Sodium-coupled monocarboxylate transporter 1 n=1 Tax=Aquatica leii TaxID=1421715 RepID=A0AAN7NZ71_9COLE|nr:hypothetical protein RN001_009146 [Aquatica leii]
MFFWYDYLLLSVMIGGSAVIGVYFGFFGKKQDNKKEYLLGGKSMSIIPIAISLIASIISGITMLLFPADVYKYGSSLIWLCVTMPIACLLQSYIFLPIFFKLQLTSVYEYLQLRFNYKCRLFASFIFSSVSLFYNATVIYIPSIAFAQATNINIHYIAFFICFLCIFYTTVGGLKAVVWTDVFQFLGMVVSTIGVVVVGFKVVGGPEIVWNTSISSGRLDIFDFRFDLKLRSNFWAISLAGTIQWMSFLIVNQSFVQKCLALPTLSKARKAVYIYGFGVMFFIFCMVLTGNIMYSKYKDCDPLSAHLVSRHDQLLPYFVVNISDQLPGLLGVFMSGCFCAALR